MSKQNNLTDFLTDVANAIRAKKGSTDLINPQNFSAEIAALSGGLEVIEMTETTATIEPNKVYVWGMVESLNITIGASTDENDFFAFRFRCSKPTMTVVTVNGATWAEDTELDTQGKPVLDLGSWYQCEIKGGTSALYARLAHYIPFEDSNVEAVLMSKGLGDGIGITYADAAKVTTISTWFKSNAEITSFDELWHFTGVTALETSAFYGCTSLTSIAVPNSLAKINNSAFQGCSSLVRVIDFENIKDNRIRDYLFKDCYSLKRIRIHSSCVYINPHAFENCTALEEVVLNDGLQLIYSNAFQNCSSLREIIIPEGVIGSYAYSFYNCTSLIYVKIPTTFYDPGASLFSGCKNLLKIDGLENSGIQIITASAFQNCSSLQQIALPASLTTIRDRAFENCSSLTEIAFPASLKTILDCAFRGTNMSGEYTFESLTTIGARVFESTKVSKMRFPSLVNSNGSSNYEGIFSYCPNLKLVDFGETCTTIGSDSFGRFVGTAGNDITFIIRATTPPTLAGKLISTQWVRAKIGVIYVPDESLEAYKTATNWSYYADIIKPLSEYTE